jgi:hypothetical protein
MKALVRGVFVALIVLGLASQALRASRSAAIAAPAEVLIGRLGHLHVTATPIAGSNWLLARSAGCGRPYAVGWMRADGAENEATRQLAKPEIEARYVYLGAVGTHPPTRQRLRWGWATLRFSAGLRATRPPGEMVVVAFPRECPALGAMDWASLSP